MFGEAITYILKSIEFDDQNTDFWLNLGYVYEEAGILDEALKCYYFITRKSPEEKEAWLSFTELMMKEGDFEKAIPFLREAYVHHPDDESIHVKLAVCHLKAGNITLASRFLQKALEINRHTLIEFEYYIRDEKLHPEIKKIIRNSNQ